MQNVIKNITESTARGLTSSLSSKTPRGTLVSTQPMSLTPQQELIAKLRTGLTGGTQQQAAPDLNAFMAMADPFTAQGLTIYGSLGNEEKVKILESKITQYTESDPALAQSYFDELTQVVANNIINPERTMGEYKLDKKGLNFGITTSFGRLPSGIHDGVIDTSKLMGGYKTSGVQQLLMAIGRQNVAKYQNKDQLARFKAITEGGKVVERDGNLYVQSSLGLEMLPSAKTITINGREIPLSIWKDIQKNRDKRSLANTAEYVRSQMALLGQEMPIGTQQALLAAGIGGAAGLAISQAEAYNQQIYKSETDDGYGQYEDKEAPGAFQAAQGRAQWLGRMTWYREQNRESAYRTGGSGHGIVNHYVKNAVSQEDEEAKASLANSHDSIVRDHAQRAFDEGRDFDLLWLRKQTINQAKALSASIAQRVAAEKATALEFGTQIGISQSEALLILRDKAQGEQALVDMLAFQLRLEAQSTGVVT